MKKVAFGAVCWALVIAVPAQSSGWSQLLTSSSPPARSRHAMAYDSARGKLVLFGGSTLIGFSLIPFNDTWEFDGTTWTQVTPAIAPSARDGHAMVYDSTRGKVVLFGGGFLGDTWEYDGVNWTQVSIAAGPAGRRAHAMSFDGARGKTVMFGGYNTALGRLGDTWEYDGSSWVQIPTSTSPSGRLDSAMVYDIARGKTVLFGGQASIPSDETWEFDGVDWAVVSVANRPLRRAGHAMAYDGVRDRTVMFGGWAIDASGLVGALSANTWEYDGTDWIQVAPMTNPAGRNGHAMVLDISHGQVVMFGGAPTLYGSSNDTWSFDGASALVSSAAVYGSGCGSPVLGFAPTSNPVLGTVASALISDAPTAFGGVTMGFSDSHLSGIPLLPMDLAFIGMPGCQLLHSNDVFGLPVTPLTATTMQFDFVLPFQVSLLGAHVYVQAYCLAPAANPLQIIASNGIDWLIGNQ